MKKQERDQARTLLRDTSFDRLVAKRDARIDLLVNLLDSNAFDPRTAVPRANSDISDDDLEDLIKRNRIELTASAPAGIYLTGEGKLAAIGELALRKREEVS